MTDDGRATKNIVAWSFSVGQLQSSVVFQSAIQTARAVRREYLASARRRRDPRTSPTRTNRAPLVFLACATTRTKTAQPRRVTARARRGATRPCNRRRAWGAIRRELQSARSI